MSEFKPLSAMVAIRGDDTLTSTHKHLLCMAALRATNKGPDAGKVRASLELLAQDASLASKTAERAFKDERVLAYFQRVDRSTRRINLWFHLTTPDTESAVSDVRAHRTRTTPDSESPTPDTESPTPDTESDLLPLPLPQPLHSHARESVNGWPAHVLHNCARRTGHQPATIHAAASKNPPPDNPTSRDLAKLLATTATASPRQA